MGQHFSRQTTTVDTASQATKKTISIKDNKNCSPVRPTTINLEIANRLSQQQLQAIIPECSSLDAAAEVRQIIIKIQLAKMENGNEAGQQQEQLQPQRERKNGSNGGAAASVTDALNANEVVNVTLSAGVERRTAGSSTEAPKMERHMNNNNFVENAAAASQAATSAATAAVSTLQLHDDDEVNSEAEADESEMTAAALLRRRRSSSAEGVDYCEVLQPTQTPTVEEMWSSSTQRAQATPSGNSCCRSRNNKSTTATTNLATPTTVASTRRCCKCKCRDALRGLRVMLDPSSSSSSSAAAAKQRNSSKEPKREKELTATTRKSRSSAEHHRRSTPPTLSSGSAVRQQTQRQRNSVAVPEAAAIAATVSPQQLPTFWTPTGASVRVNGDVFIRISSPQFVVEPGAVAGAGAGCSVCTSPLVTVGRLNEAGVNMPVRLVAAPEPNIPVPPPSQHVGERLQVYGGGVTVHSQIDFMHCLVPDLEQIINASFYWGKMDRYEAERLLEGKPEGTFLLRDSAQEEFLFSVTFRKYGRSLHARIEQSGHKFSFDCHDPCVFTAPTVTGLLEHYKDPSCVMFFEPCLTQPLHRRQTFSLQQLSRAAIVSNTTYDGINQLELPGRLKSYLKEYHYKQKLRVKPCDANTPFYANI